MNFLSMLIVIVLVPIIMIICGWVIFKNTPKKINRLFGYRTKRSMKNIDTWIFAQKHYGKISIIIGMVLLILSIFISILFRNNSSDVIEIASLIIILLQIIVLIASLIPTELTLKNRVELK